MMDLMRDMSVVVPTVPCWFCQMEMQSYLMQIPLTCVGAWVSVYVLSDFEFKHM